MNRLTVWLSEHRTGATRAGIVTVLVVVSVVLVVRGFSDDHPSKRDGLYSVKIKHAVSGHKVEIKSGGELTYAGIRGPYQHEPFYEESRKANADLVNGRRGRLRYDEQERDRKGRLHAYVFVDGVFVNERLVQQGLVYVRLTPDTPRYADQLLAAQAEARQAKLGMWSIGRESDETNYPADPKYGTFHRPSCEETPKINPQRRQDLQSRDEAFDIGLAPCSKCLP